MVSWFVRNKHSFLRGWKVSIAAPPHPLVLRAGCSHQDGGTWYQLIKPKQLCTLKECNMNLFIRLLSWTYYCPLLLFMDLDTDFISLDHSSVLFRGFCRFPHLSPLMSCSKMQMNYFLDFGFRSHLSQVEVNLMKIRLLQASQWENLQKSAVDQLLVLPTVCVCVCDTRRPRPSCCC